MATRPKTYQNYVPPAGGRKYRITENADGTVTINDATEYLTVGDPWTAADGNLIWDALEDAAVKEEVDAETEEIRENYVPKTGATMRGTLIAASGAIGVNQVRNVVFGDVELEAGSASAYPDGTIYFVLEES